MMSLDLVPSVPVAIKRRKTVKEQGSSVWSLSIDGSPVSVVPTTIRHQRLDLIVNNSHTFGPADLVVHAGGSSIVGHRRISADAAVGSLEVMRWWLLLWSVVKQSNDMSLFERGASAEEQQAAYYHKFLRLSTGAQLRYADFAFESASEEDAKDPLNRPHPVRVPECVRYKFLTVEEDLENTMSVKARTLKLRGQIGRMQFAGVVPMDRCSTSSLVPIQACDLVYVRSLTFRSSHGPQKDDVPVRCPYCTIQHLLHYEGYCIRTGYEDPRKRKVYSSFSLEGISLDGLDEFISFSLMDGLLKNDYEKTRPHLPIVNPDDSDKDVKRQMPALVPVRLKPPPK
jgi:hypothetical protein